MTRLITLLALLLAKLVAAQTFEQNMQTSLQLWQNNSTSEALAQLDKLANEQPDNWLPNYYIGLIHVTQAFALSNHKTEMIKHLEQADRAVQKIYDTQLNNSEVLVLVGMLQTAYIVYNPMANAMSLSSEVHELYQKALKIDPNNPRAILQKAEFDMGTARYFGQSTVRMCNEIQKTIALFDTFEPASPLHPSWGKDLALKTLETSCKQ